MSDELEQRLGRAARRASTILAADVLVELLGRSSRSRLARDRRAAVDAGRRASPRRRGQAPRQIVAGGRQRRRRSPRRRRSRACRARARARRRASSIAQIERCALLLLADRLEPPPLGGAEVEPVRLPFPRHRPRDRAVAGRRARPAPRDRELGGGWLAPGDQRSSSLRSHRRSPPAYAVVGRAAARPAASTSARRFAASSVLVAVMRATSASAP